MKRFFIYVKKTRENFSKKFGIFKMMITFAILSEREEDI